MLVEWFDSRTNWLICHQPQYGKLWLRSIAWTSNSRWTASCGGFMVGLIVHQKEIDETCGLPSTSNISSRLRCPWIIGWWFGLDKLLYGSSNLKYQGDGSTGVSKPTLRLSVARNMHEGYEMWPLIWTAKLSGWKMCRTYRALNLLNQSIQKTFFYRRYSDHYFAPFIVQHKSRQPVFPRSKTSITKSPKSKGLLFHSAVTNVRCASCGLLNPN